MISRREFIKICMSTTITFSLSQTLLPMLATAIENKTISKPPVIWLELGSCTGDSISFENSFDPSLKRIFEKMIDLRYHWVILPASGIEATKAIEQVIKDYEGEFILIVEGSAVTANYGKYNYIYLKEDNQLVTGLDALKELGSKAKHVVAIGNCACFGGPSAAAPNPSGSVGIWEVLSRKVINVAGCPAHPDWFVGTLAHLILYGEPDLDKWNRPKMFFGSTIHDLCQRRSDYENGKFAEYPGGEGCFYKVGCKGPVTFADCPKRQWNNHINWPVKGGTPCIGCTNPGFPDSSEPFFEHLPNAGYRSVKVTADTIGMAAGAITAAGIGGHLITSAVKGHISKNYTDGTRPKDSSPDSKVVKDEVLLNKLETMIDKQDTILKEIGHAEKEPNELNSEVNNEFSSEISLMKKLIKFIIKAKK